MDDVAIVPEAVCTCELATRQRDAARDAALIDHAPPTLTHTDRCDVTLRDVLVVTIDRLAVMDSELLLPDPLLERMRDDEKADLRTLRDNLLVRLTASDANGSEDWFDGTDKITNRSRPRRRIATPRETK